MYYVGASRDTSPQYNAVLKKLQVLTEYLQHTKVEETLLQKFKMQRWIAVGATATANELVELALNRIKNQVADYYVFIKSLPGVESIADEMIGTHSHVLVCFVNCRVWLTVMFLCDNLQ